MKKMSRITTVLCYFYIFYVTAATAQGKTTNLKERELLIIPGDDSVKTKNKLLLNQEKPDIHMSKHKFSLKDSDIKINDTDLYENGKETKENNERSFIIINQKFKSQILKSRPIQQKSFLEGDIDSPDLEFSMKSNDFNAEDIIQPTFKNEISDEMAQMAQYFDVHKVIPSYFRQVPQASASAPAQNKGEYVELLKRPLVRPISKSSNNREQVLSPVKEFFRSHDEGLDNNNLFQIMDFSSDVQKNTLQDDDMDTDRMAFENIEDDDAKLDQHLKSALQDVTSNEKDKYRYDCYNSKCKGVLNKHNTIMNNGVKIGSYCLCLEAVLSDRSSRRSMDMRNNTPAAGESTELSGSEEAVVKETTKLLKIGDGNVKAKQ